LKTKNRKEKRLGRRAPELKRNPKKQRTEYREAAQEKRAAKTRSKETGLWGKPPETRHRGRTSGEEGSREDLEIVKALTDSG